jgi:hypothetical protein
MRISYIGSTNNLKNKKICSQFMTSFKSKRSIMSLPNGNPKLVKSRKKNRKGKFKTA